MDPAVKDSQSIAQYVYKVFSFCGYFPFVIPSMYSLYWIFCPMVIFGHLVLYLFGHVVIFSVIWIRSNGPARTSPLFKSSQYFSVLLSSYVLHANYSNTVWMQSITTNFRGIYLCFDCKRMSTQYLKTCKIKARFWKIVRRSNFWIQLGSEYQWVRYSNGQTCLIVKLFSSPFGYQINLVWDL